LIPICGDVPTTYPRARQRRRWPKRWRVSNVRNKPVVIFVRQWSLDATSLDIAGFGIPSFQGVQYQESRRMKYKITR